MKDTTSIATETGKKPDRFIKLAVGMEESVDEFRTLEDERCIDKGVFPNRSLLHELVFACDDIPPRPRISFTLLTQSDWCCLEDSCKVRGGLVACCWCHARVF